jgi:(2Fe-2S) ferredoxin
MNASVFAAFAWYSGVDSASAYNVIAAAVATARPVNLQAIAQIPAAVRM